jgi:hypothetical protein
LVRISLDLPCFSIILLILCGIQASIAFAGNLGKATLETMSSTSQGSSFRWEELSVEAHEAEMNGETVARVELSAIWDRPDWSILVDDRNYTLNRPDPYKIKVLVNLTGPRTPVEVLAIGPRGEKEIQKWEISFTSWNSYQANLKSRTKRPSGILSVDTQVSMGHLTASDKGTGGKASLDSSFIGGAGLEYGHQFNSRLDGVLFFDYQHLSFETPSTNLLVTPSTSLVSFGAGVRWWSENKKFSVLGTLMRAQIPFLEGISQSQVVFDTRAVLVTGLLASANLYRSTTYLFDAQGGIESYLPTTTDAFSSQFNWGYLARLAYVRNLSQKLKFETGVSARLINENTSIVNQQQVEYGVDLRFYFPIGGRFSL